MSSEVTAQVACIAVSTDGQAPLQQSTYVCELLLAVRAAAVSTIATA